MEHLTRRIVFVGIPHIFAEAEELRLKKERGQYGPSVISIVIASGTSPKSIVIDYSIALEGSGLRRGTYVKDLERALDQLHDKSPVASGEKMRVREISPTAQTAAAPAAQGERIQVLPVDHEYVWEMHKKLLSNLERYSPRVESKQAGNYFVDLTGTRRLFGRELDTCGKIVRELREEFGFHARTGIGSTTFVAQMAAAVAGSSGVYHICEAAEGPFLAPLRIELIPGLSREAKRELCASYNIRNIGDLAPFTKDELSSMVGREGGVLYGCARNISRSRLLEKKTEQHLELELALSSEDNDDRTLRRQFFSMVAELCARMREDRLLPGAFSLKVVYQDGYRFTRAGALHLPSSFEKSLYHELIGLLNTALKRRVCIKKIGLSFFNFAPLTLQLELFSDALKAEKLAEAFDTLKRRFGKNSIRYGGQQR